MRTLLVICVLFVLTWWLVRPRVSSIGATRAPITEAQTQISSFTTALGAFMVDIGFYPPTQPGLSALLSNSNASMGWKGPYLKDIPKDPWGNHYVYHCPGVSNTNTFDLVSWGPDEKPNTADDIINPIQTRALILKEQQ
jgi:general secretion pathway protein G